MQNETAPQEEVLSDNQAPQKTDKNGNPFWELIKFSLIALLIVLPIRTFIAQPFVVSGSSMVPTFENGEYLIIDETYQFRTPQRGDVVVFHPPQYEENNIFFIKRIVGLPGDTIQMNKQEIIIYNDEHPDGKLLTEPYVENHAYGNMTVTLGPEEYFVLGDNRNHSSDSRTWGALNEDLIVGRALLRLFPLSEATVLPGDYKK